MNSVVIVDDHALIRIGLSEALTSAGFTIISEAASKSEALAVLNKFNPDFCIVDLNLGDGNGLEIITEIMGFGSLIKFVVLTMNDDQSNLDLAKSSGASAYILKSSPVSELVSLLSSISDGNHEFKSVGKVNKTTPVKDFGLTAKEMEVLQLLGSGTTAVVMGKQLFLTEATIKTHLAAIYRKLSASNRAQAVNIAISNNLINS
ncbi:MAG: DNA-binding response regulator [Actinobacteria bacterium]|nr:DNA-binding response regulator [Actinomycetota bacterium]